MRLEVAPSKQQRGPSIRQSNRQEGVTRPDRTGVKVNLKHADLLKQRVNNKVVGKS